MDRTAALRIVDQLKPEAIVADVGGGASPFARADYVIDAIPFAERAMLGTNDLGIKPRYNAERWTQLDVCARAPWPFPDKVFDFATCSHLLEDVRDPIWICGELSRVAKGGYVEVPSRILEQSLGVENPSYAGYYHHRWLVTIVGGVLEFRHKPHSLHSIRRAIVARVGIRRQINPSHAITQFWWQDSIQCCEVLEFSEDRVIDELCDFAAKARRLPDVVVPSGRTGVEALKRAVYFGRLKAGLR